MKKLITILLAIVMTISCSFSVFAFQSVAVKWRSSLQATFKLAVPEVSKAFINSEIGCAFCTS